MNVLNLRGPEFLGFYITLLVHGIAAALLLRWWLRQPGDALPPGRVPELHPLEVAYLAGGAKGVIDAALALLVQRGNLSIDLKMRRLVASSLGPQDVTPLEEEVFGAVDEHGGRVSSVRRAVLETAHSAAARLQALGLAMTRAQGVRARVWPAMIFLALLVLGVAKIFVGVERDKPVGFLIALCVVTLFVGILFVIQSPVRTRRGAKLLARLRERNAALRATAGRAPNSLAGDDLSLALALFGAGVFAFGPMADLNRTLKPPAQGGSGCGSSSGCGGSSSGSSCGGGGGGCGGGGCGGCGGS